MVPRCVDAKVYLSICTLKYFLFSFAALFESPLKAVDGLGLTDQPAIASAW